MYLFLYCKVQLFAFNAVIGVLHCVWHLWKFLTIKIVFHLCFSHSTQFLFQSSSWCSTPVLHSYPSIVLHFSHNRFTNNLCSPSIFRCLTYIMHWIILFLLTHWSWLKLYFISCLCSSLIHCLYYSIPSFVASCLQFHFIVKLFQLFIFS